MLTLLNSMISPLGLEVRRKSLKGADTAANDGMASSYALRR
jgi:hypothetical protein